MITVIDIIRALTERLEKEFPNYPVTTRDLTEGFDRPSYYIDVEEVRSGQLTSDYVREAADLIIYYFAEDIYKGFLDLLNVKAKLQEILDEPLKVEVGCHAVFSNVNITISNTDKALICTCSTEIIQEVNREPDLPLMEELSY